MAKNVWIRNVPEEVHRTLKSRAEAALQSLSEYLVAEIVRIAERPPVAEVLRRADSRTGGVSVHELVAAVRSGREPR